MSLKRLIAVLLACWLLPGATAALDLSRQRSLFLETETLLERGRSAEAEINLQSLRDYPLYAVLQYRKLQNRLWLQSDIEKFIAEFGDTRYADELRKQWLRYLASNRQWDVFLRYFRANDETALQCLRLQAQSETGSLPEALQAARELWTVGNSQPDECATLFTTLQNSPYLSDDLKWRRFELALQAGNTGVALHTKRMLGALQQPAADFWLEVHQHPRQIEDWNAWKKPYPQLGAIFAHGVMRLAEVDLESALAVWEQRRTQFAIDGEHADQVEKTLGVLLARQKDLRAYGHLSSIASNSDAALRELTVRAALLEQNWQHVDAALQRLSEDQKSAPQWQYWLARSLQETGRTAQADAVFNRLAQDRSYYGFLAADYTGQTYRLSDRPAPVTLGDLEALNNRRAFKMVEELRHFGRDNEATRQWWFAVEQLDKQQQILAAKLAQQWSWHPIAIFTLARADYWDDINLRFPLVYLEQIKRHAQRQGLEPSLVFGLVRQESVFDSGARSAANARGLMQLMPDTGRHIAGQFHEHWNSADDLFDPETNLKYGAFYYKQLMDRFGGNAALAAAGYNAGPQRIVQWRPNDRPMPADVWIETIPFKETRKYVSSVLAYSLIYQQRLGSGSLKLKDLMRAVFPG